MAKKKVVKVKLTKEEYKNLKKHAKNANISPKKYLNILASQKFCNGVTIEYSKVGDNGGLHIGKTDDGRPRITIVEQGTYYESITRVAISKFLKEKAMRDKKKKGNKK